MFAGELGSAGFPLSSSTCSRGEALWISGMKEYNALNVDYWPDIILCLSTAGLLPDGVSLH